MSIQAILDNVELVKLCNEGFGILYKVAEYIGKITKEDYENNKKLSPIVLVYSNALIFLNSAFSDALEGKYPSSVNNLRASLETHLVMEKLNASTDEEFKAYIEHKDPKNKETLIAYWKIFKPYKIIKSLSQDVKDKFKIVYDKMSQYSHSGIRGIVDNVLEEKIEGRNLITISPFYQKNLTCRQLKDLLVMIWLNTTTISKIFSYRIPDEVKQKIELWGDKLEDIGSFSKE